MRSQESSWVPSSHERDQGLNPGSNKQNLVSTSLQEETEFYAPQHAHWESGEGSADSYDCFDFNGTPLLRGDVVKALTTIESAGIERFEVVIVCGFEAEDQMVHIFRHGRTPVCAPSSMFELL